MNNPILKKIDTVIQKIKKKCDIDGVTAADIFMIFSFEILRFEILLQRISDNTVSAMSEIASTTSHFYYFRDYSELYKDIQDIYIDISYLDDRFNDADFISSVNFELYTWTRNISEASEKLLQGLPMSYFTKED